MNIFKILFILVASHYRDEFETIHKIIRILIWITFPMTYIFILFYFLYLQIKDLWNFRK